MPRMGTKPATNFPIAIVVSRFNHEITERLLDGAKKRLKELGFSEHNIVTHHVPGAIEIPLVVQRLAKTHRFDAIVALGCVVFQLMIELEPFKSLWTQIALQTTSFLPAIFSL